LLFPRDSSFHLSFNRFLKQPADPTHTPRQTKEKRAKFFADTKISEKGHIYQREFMVTKKD